MSKYVSQCKDTSGKNHRFSAVWDGYYDAEVSKGNEYFTGVNSRALEVLDNDILVYHETMKISSPTTVTQNIELAEDNGANVPRYGAISAIYKALGQYKYRTKVTFRTDYGMSLTNSPIGQYIAGSLLTPSIDASEGEAWVWIGRSNCNDYLLQALEDNVIHSNSQELQSLVGAAKPDKKLQLEFQDTISLGEFCVYVQRLAEIYGEPVLTEQEKQILLQCYGASLPYYLDEDVYDAVEYLAAKGILEPSGVHSIDFTAKLTASEMLDILMRLKDKGSRYTFKEITPTIDVALANKGYYESSISTEASPVYGIGYDYTETDYYDYVIVPTQGKTMLVTNNKPNIKGLAIQSWSRDGDKLIGNADITSKGYVHFTISKEDAERYEKNGLLRIGWLKNSGKRYKDYFSITPVGGTFKYKEELWSSKHKLSRKAFTEADYVDAERSPSKSQDEESESGTQVSTQGQFTVYTRHLAAPMTEAEVDDTIPIVFTLRSTEEYDNFSKVEICDKTLEAIFGDSNEGVVEYSTNDDDEDESSEEWTVKRQKISTDLYSIFVTGPKSLTTFKGQISVDPGATTSMTVHKLFLKTKNECILVNYDWLVQTGVVYQKIKLKGGVYCLTTKYNNVYLCPEQHCIIVGQIIMQIHDDERVLYYEKDGELYVDLQALVGWSGGFDTLYSNYRETVNSDESNVSISIPDLWTNAGYVEADANNNNYTLRYKINNVNVYYPIEASNGSNALKKTCTTIPIMSNGGGVQPKKRYYNFAMSYSLANYFIVQSGNSDAYLFVFKNARAKAFINDKWRNPLKFKKLKDNNDKARDKLKQLLGIDEVPKDWLVQMYSIGSPENCDDYRITALKSGNEVVSFLYDLPRDLPTIEGEDENAVPVWQDKYFVPVEDFKKKKDALLPFWYTKTEDSEIMSNMNLNSFEYGGEALRYGDLPAMIYGNNSKIYVVEPYKTRTNGYNEYNAIVSMGAISSDNFVMYPAPTGCIQEMFDFWSIDYEKANLYAKKFNIFSGTCPLYYNDGNLFLRFKAAESHNIATLDTVVVDEQDSIRMSEISEDEINSLYILGTSRAGYILGLKPKDTLTDKDSPLVVDDADVTVGEGTPVIDFDWDHFTFTNLIHDVDSGLSIILIFCLNIIPRVFMFVCMFLIMLAVVKESPIVKRFSEKVFDPYKLLTFGGRDITSINAFKLLWDSIIGLAIFGLFMDGAILQLIAWVARAIAAIVSR